MMLFLGAMLNSETLSTVWRLNMKKLMSGFAVLALCASASAQELSEEDQYWDTVFRLVDTHVLMDQAGVFIDAVGLQYARQAGNQFDYEILGGQAPGGFYSRPPGSVWLEEVQALQNTPNRCLDIPPLLLRDSICGSEVLSLYSTWNDMATAEMIVAIFHLARVCRDSAKTCEPYMR